MLDITTVSILLLAQSPAHADAPDRTTATQPANTQSLPRAVSTALANAGANAPELRRALDLVPDDQRDSLIFLISNMPRRDLESLSAEFLLNNVRLAHQVMTEVPWGSDVPREMFLNNILPYASLNERRDDWRGDFHERFIGIAKEAETIEAAVLALNKAAFDTLNVRYHATKRPKPDQSPYESIEAGFASCTGLSILLTDVLRAVGIPARCAGTPLWTDKSGNHTWVEVWNGRWHHVGAAEPRALDVAWFNAKASRADPSTPEHRIYAASFKRTSVVFPLVWDESIDDVHAVDVTARYTSPTEP